MATEKQRETALRNLEKARQALAARAAAEKDVPRQAEKGATAEDLTESEGGNARHH